MNIHEQVIHSMQEMVEKFGAAGITLQLPPPSTKAIGTEYTAMDFGKSLAARIPFEPKFTNPLFMYQGGFLGAAFDEVFGPLTYMAALRPAVTLEMSVTFMRPFTAADKHIDIKASLVSKTRSILVLNAEAINPQGKLIAIAQNHSIISSDENLSRHKNNEHSKF